jgi:hypothetical protein
MQTWWVNIPHWLNLEQAISMMMSWNIVFGVILNVGHSMNVMVKTITVLL